MNSDEMDLNNLEEHSINQPRLCDHELRQFLPETLLEIVDLVEEDKQDLLLFSSLIGLSAVLPTLQAKYSGNTIWSNLFGIVLGTSGSGKGMMNKVKILLEYFHVAKRHSYERDYTAYIESLSEHKRKKSKDIAPVPPSQKFLFAPLDLTKAALIDTLHSNPDGVLFMETEADVLVSSNKRDTGDFIHILRMTFHHETVSNYIKTNKEYKSIESPKTSLLLSGTPYQIKSLLKSGEEGLLSRILLFRTYPDLNFKNPLNPNMDNLDQELAKIGERLFSSINKAGANGLIKFSFNDEFEKNFLEGMTSLKKTIVEDNEELNGISNRLGLIAFRLAMILAALRHLPWQGNELTGTKDDIKAALIITQRLAPNTLEYLQTVKAPKKYGQTDHKITEHEKMIIVQLRSEGHSFRVISKMVFGDDSKKSTIQRLCVQNANK